MSLFGGSKKQSMLGVDIGIGGIKLVELTKEKGHLRLLTYGYSQGFNQTSFSPFDEPKQTAELLQTVVKKAQVSSRTAIAALPLSSIFSTIVSVPYQKNQAAIKESVQSQVRKLTPLPLEEMITYSTFIDPIEKKDQKTLIKQTDEIEKKNIRVLVTGSAKTLVQKYIDIFKQAKLQLKALDTESFALIRSLIGKDKSSMMLVDMGSSRSNMTVVEKGIPFYTRSVDMGGKKITEKFMTQMGLSEIEAEQMKRDLVQTNHEIESGKTPLPKLFEEFLEPLLNEMRYSLKQYESMEVRENHGVEKIILTGGSAHLPGIRHYFANALNMNVYVGDPWARILYPEDLRPVLEEIGPSLSVAIGLAMRESDL
ncbi:hypothetical protein CO172_00795 [Candidatus Uhrbacteria bacterium CG_4_9_14_3_um_filter_36_7]|uniref:SHS2 domain-containing protein n=1 Tax=Candidatus Uhrbacteria bacterium CG_4_9_14_3_um_filter_36_7 TaxID=1975033 RepID=A0A2M7XI23_9BACT|nr:MAG: hypothetical protein CO172_00795 [Candidatus Uhrbacteria bacterium CG_4_9_14_3_um_filter_36_7]